MSDPRTFNTREELTSFLKDVHKLKPKDLILDDLKWRHLVRAILKGKNTLITGPTRCGKTTAARAAATALGRSCEVFNFGGTQDARATLVGNTTYSKETGTVFNRSPFVTGIQTPYTVMILDELTRGSYDAWNIAMPVIDETQRCLRLDESAGGEVIPVEKTVSFIATANIGVEYTATKTLDLATSFRFTTTIEMERLKSSKMMSLLKIKFPDSTSKHRDQFEIITEISDAIAEESRKEGAQISTEIPNGRIIEMADLVMDGFTLKEIAEVAIYPIYLDDGGMASERVYIKQLVQRYLDSGGTSPLRDPLADVVQ